MLFSGSHSAVDATLRLAICLVFIPSDKYHAEQADMKLQREREVQVKLFYAYSISTAIHIH
jgi:hypothetical protein